MGAFVSSTFVTTPANLMADLKVAILSATDWTELADWDSLSGTTFNGAEAIGQTVLSVASASTYIVGGDLVVLSPGTANEEVVRVVSSTTSSITVDTATAFAHSIGDTISIRHSDVVGLAGGPAVDLSNIPDNTRAKVTVYRDLGGATPADGKSVYPRFMMSAAPGSTTTNMPVHVQVSAGPDFLFVLVEGPRAGESYAESTIYRDVFWIDRLLPYDSADTSSPFVLGGRTTDAGTTTSAMLCSVDRNATDTASWAPALIGSIMGQNSSGAAGGVSVNPRRGSTRFFWPWVISEVSDGPRGRFASIFYAGASGQLSQSLGGPYDVAGRQFAKNGVTYEIIQAGPQGGSAYYGPFGAGGSGSHSLVLVPVAGTPV